MLAGVHHINVVPFLGGSLHPPHVCIIEALMERTLGDRLHGNTEPLPLWTMLGLALDVACGLEYLHSRVPAIVHRDLKVCVLVWGGGRRSGRGGGMKRGRHRLGACGGGRTGGGTGGAGEQEEQATPCEQVRACVCAPAVRLSGVGLGAAGMCCARCRWGGRAVGPRQGTGQA